MWKWTLTKRIWLSSIALILIIGLVVGLVYPFSLQKALEEDSFNLIKHEQLRYVVPNIKDYSSRNNSDTSLIDREQASRSVGHLIIFNNYVQGDMVPISVYEKMLESVNQQTSALGEYELDYEDSTLFYVVRKVTYKGNQGYLISYMKDQYTNQMTKLLWWKLIYVFLFAGLVALLLTAWLIRYLKQPLRALGQRFEEISRFNWRKPFEWKSGDEFEQLSNQFEDMRQNLVRYDDAQRRFLQQASHELKTPIMVIQSYAQSVKDGIYPADQLDQIMDVIKDEAALMEQRVKKLLFYTRVDSLRDEKPDLKSIRFGELAQTIKERFSGSASSPNIEIIGPETVIPVDEEQWLIVLENLVENAMRYAEHKIILKSVTKGRFSEVTVKNDGPPIPDDQLTHLFEPFKKGTKGQFGLGLAIVKLIVDRHNGDIKVENRSEGVAFVITLPNENISKS